MGSETPQINKIKGKRSRSPPDEETNPFKNMARKVTKLLPASLANWFSPSSANSNGSAQAAENTDSSTDDETVESPEPAEPPTKRMRYGNTSPVIVENLAFVPDPSTLFQGNTKSYDIPDTAEASSAYKSIQSTPRPRPSKPAERSSDDSVIKKQPERSTSGFHSSGLGSISKRKAELSSARISPASDSRALAVSKSIQSMLSTPSTSKDTMQPYFKASLLGSPFYPGRTMYGGASGSSFYLNQPNIQQRKTAIVNKSYDDSTVKHYSRNILDVLEQYSSPLHDAKRIAPYTKCPNKTPSSYKTRELNVSSIASSLRMKHQSRLMKSTSAARQTLASLSSTSDDTYSKARAMETQLSLQKTKDMNMDIGGGFESIIRCVESEGKMDESDMPSPVLQTTQKDDLFRSTFCTDDSSKFKFSTPVKLSSPDLTEKEEAQFVFGSPERKSIFKSVGEVSDVDVVTHSIASITEVNKVKLTEKSTDWKCNDCWVSNKSKDEKCVCCGSKKPSTEIQPKTTKPISCDAIQNNSLNSLPFVKDPTKWSCQDCFVSNDQNADKCVCCSGPNPKKADSTPALTKSSPEPTPKIEWRCEECWVVNKSDNRDKCVACGTKPDEPETKGKRSKNTPFKSTDSGFTSLLQKQTQKWECESCLVRNENEIVECACCGSVKPGMVTEVGKNFSFGETPNMSYKFGIDTKLQDTSEEIKPFGVTTQKVEESETNNNVLSKTPSFSFGIPEKKTIEPNAVTESLTTGFTFNVPAKQTITTKSSPQPTKSLNSIINALNAAKKDQEQEVPKMKLPEPQPTPTLSLSSGGFTPNLTSQTTEEKTAPSFTSVPLTLQNKENVLFSNQQTLAPPISNVSVSTSISFTSSAPVVTPGSIIFGTPSLPAANTGTFAPPSTLANSLGSMIQNPIVTANSTASQLQKQPEPIYAAPAATKAPIFSFGTSTPAPAQPAPIDDKAKFNFSFGTTNTDPTSVFKSAFPAPTDNKVSQFTLQTENKPLPTLSAQNLLSTGNSTANLTSVPVGNIFGAPPQKENAWPAPNTGNNMFATSAATNPLQKPPAFSFGSTTFNPSAGASSVPAFGSAQLGVNPAPTFGSPSASQTPAFGSNPSNTTLTFGSNPSTSNQIPTFGSNTSAPPYTMTNPLSATTSSMFGSSQPAVNQTPTFGNNSTSANMAPVFGTIPAATLTPAFGSGAPTSMFGISSQGTNSQPSMFGNPTQSPAPMFGSPQQSNDSSMGGIFGTSNSSQTMSFGSQNPPTLPTAAPAFNFGSAQQPSSGIFGFGQPQQQPQAGVYSFGGSQAATPQVQFNMGSFTGTATGGPQNTAVRRVRKAVRRTTPR